MLRVRIRGEEFRADDSGLHEPIDRVAASAADAHDLDVGPEAREDALELGVLRLDPHGRSPRLEDPGLNAGAGDNFPDDGIHSSASGYLRKAWKEPRRAHNER